MRSDPTSPIVRRRSSPISPRLVFGLLLIFIGVVFTLDQMGWIRDAEDILRFWPLILIAAGLGKVLWPGSSGSWLAGGLLVAIGVWLQLDILGLVEVRFWDYWPVILILIGARIAWRGLGGERRMAAADGAATVNAVAVMSGARRTSNAPDFLGGDLIAFMGGAEIDLRQARIATGPAVIDAFAFWGGVEIRVPEDWTVIMKGVPLLGGYEDNTRPPQPVPGERRQELVVKGFAIMGGVEVKN